MSERRIAGRYLIERELGRGGMGVVYQARDTHLPRTVALKTVPADVANHAELRRRLSQEARTVSTLNHPGIAAVHDLVEDGAELYVVYEYVEGETLRQKIHRGRVRTAEILNIGMQLAEALAAAHDHGVVHRDLKPENVLLTGGPGSPRTKILDFGLAKTRKPLSPASGSDSADTATVATAAGLIVGSVNYMAPEQIEGEAVDARTDIFSLGLVLYELTTGANPFLGKTPTSTIANILKMEVPPSTQRSPATPPELDRVLRKCLRKRPDERYQTVRDLLADLRSLDRALVASPGSEPAQDSVAKSPGSGVFSRTAARWIFAAMQAGYLVMYGAAFYRLEEFMANLDRIVFPEYLEIYCLLALVIGTPIRLYLLTAQIADYPDLGRKFRWLFPVSLVVDIVWAASPLSLLHSLRGLAILGIAGLAFLPFAQRRLIYDAYSPAGGRSSAIRPRSDQQP